MKGEVRTNTLGLDGLIAFSKARDVTLKGAKAAGRIVSRAAKARAPKASGALKAAIGVKAAKGTKGETDSYAVVGARKKVVRMVTRKGRRKAQKAVPAFYLHLVEKGTKPHAVGKGSTLGKKGKAAVQAGGMHPGVAARPFLQPAFEGSQDEAAAAAIEAMKTEYAKQMAKESAKVLAKLGGK